MKLFVWQSGKYFLRYKSFEKIHCRIGHYSVFNDILVHAIEVMMHIEVVAEKSTLCNLIFFLNVKTMYIDDIVTNALHNL